MSIAYNDVLVTAMNINDGLIPKLILDTRLSTGDIARVTAIKTKIDGTTDLSRREVNELLQIIKKSITRIDGTA